MYVDSFLIIGKFMPRIPASEIDRIKTEVSLLDWVRGQGYEVKKQGKDYGLCCPFHDDKTPSCMISPSKNVYHCFGCEAKGSVIDWVMQTQSVSFPHAMELLKSGSPSSLAVSHSSRDKTKVARSSMTHLEPLCPSDADGQSALQSVVGFYHQNLLNNTEGMAYLEKRGLMHPELVKYFKLGLSNKTLMYRLPAKHTKAGMAIRDTLKQVGVLRQKMGVEHFAGCLVVPVIDERGQVQEVYGRRLSPKAEKASRHLYLPGSHRGVFNLPVFNAANEIIVCESLIDALTFWVHGFKHVTCSYGTGGFTDEYLKALSDYSIEKVFIAYDNDEAGNKATTALVETLSTSLPALQVYRVQFPEGMDANEYALKVKPAQQSLERLLRQAQPMNNATDLQQQSERVDQSATSSLAVQTTPINLQSDANKNPQDDCPVEVTETEIKLTLGNRFYRVRGLDKNLSLGQLKINLLVQVDGHLHVDTLDLYQSRQRNSFIQQAAIECGMDDKKIKNDLGRLLLKLEQIQEENISKAQEKQPETITISNEDQAAALALLKDKNLINKIKEDFNTLGIVGEDTNVLTGYLAAVSRKLDRPLAVMIQSSSAAGKSALMDAVLNLVPSEERVQYSAMTGQSLFYMGETNLKHKILAIAEEEGASNASYALKLLQSEGEVTIASTGKDDNSGQLVTREYRVEGPVMLFLTTTAIDIDEELMNRCLVLSVNETREQTQRIHQLQRQRQTLEGLLLENDKSDLTNLHQNAQRLIRTLLVANPYAEQLTFLDTQTRTRRDHMKYLTLIKSIALLHQYQREIKRIERNGQVLEYIEVQPSDIELANQLAHEVLGRTLDELPPQTRKLLSLMYGWVKQQCDAETITQRDFRFSRREVREATGWGNTQIRIHMDRLVDMEYVIVHRGGRGQTFTYELVYGGNGEHGEAFISGLITPNLTNGDNLAGKDERLAGSKRPQNGAKTVGLRSAKTPLQASDTVDLEELIANSVEKDLLEKNKKVPSGDSLPLMVMS
jgi:DNA primase catalytic core